VCHVQQDDQLNERNDNVTLFPRHCRWHVVTSVFAITAAPLMSGCDGTLASPSVTIACRTLSLCDEPAKPAELWDIVCDHSFGSSCTPQTAPRTLEPVLRRAAARPGSRVRFWVLEPTAAETTMVGEQTAHSANRGSDRSRRAQADRFVGAATNYFLAAAGHAFDAPQIRRSPIAESLTRVALADTGGLPRRIVAITDGREVSDLGDFECWPLPTEAQFLALLRKRNILGPGTLARSSVDFAFLESTPVPGRSGCPARVERELRVRALWNAALRAAGAESVRIGSGPPSVDGEQAPSSQSQGGMR
jgi:hypothetical protein